MKSALPYLEEHPGSDHRQGYGPVRARVCGIFCVISLKPNMALRYNFRVAPRFRTHVDRLTRLFETTINEGGGGTRANTFIYCTLLPSKLEYWEGGVQLGCNIRLLNCLKTAKIICEVWQTVLEEGTSTSSSHRTQENEGGCSNS